MPISADPNATFPVSLIIDQKLPDETRPAFFVRFLTELESSKVAALIAEAHAEAKKDPPSDERVRVLLEQAIAHGVTGWRNMRLRGEEVAAGTPLRAFLTADEMWELVYLVLYRQRVAEADRKKSISQSTTTPATSASVATTPASA